MSQEVPVSHRRVDFLEAGFRVAHAIASGQVSRLNKDASLLSSMGVDPGRCIEISARDEDVGPQLIEYFEHSVESLQPGQHRLAIWFLVGFYTVYLLSRSDNVRTDPVMSGALKNPFELLVGIFRGQLAKASVSRRQIREVLELVREEKATPDRKAVIVQSVIDDLREEAHRQDEGSSVHTSAPVRNPWIAGSFYLVTVTTIMVLIGVLAKSLPVLALPGVVLSGIFLVIVVGIFTLRQSEGLREETFVTLLVELIKRLPLLNKFF